MVERMAPWGALRGENMRRARSFTAAVMAGTMLAGSAYAQQSDGITTPTVLPPFDPSAARCTVPSGLTRTIAFAKDNTRQFIEGVGYGLKQAAEDRGLSYAESVADNDAGKQAADIDAFAIG